MTPYWLFFLIPAIGSLLNQRVNNEVKLLGFAELLNNKIYQIENKGYYPDWQTNMWVISQHYIEIDNGYFRQSLTYPSFTNIADKLKTCIQYIDDYEIKLMEV